MSLESAYCCLEHMGLMLKRNTVSVLRLDEEQQRQLFVDAIREVLPILEQNGVVVDRTSRPDWLTL